MRFEVNNVSRVGSSLDGLSGVASIATANIEMDIAGNEKDLTLAFCLADWHIVHYVLGPTDNFNLSKMKNREPFSRRRMREKGSIIVGSLCFPTKTGQ
jgi:hypothetical protein